MNSSPRFFSTSNESTVYPTLKALFLKLFAETESRCSKLCRNKYDQERYAMVTIHPDINDNKNKIHNSKNIILEEIDKIEKLDGKNEYFYRYAFGLSELKFNSLFMQIFVGKLNKHWIPAAIENKISINQDNIKLTY